MRVKPCLRIGYSYRTVCHLSDLPSVCSFHTLSFCHHPAASISAPPSQSSLDHSLLRLQLSLLLPWKRLSGDPAGLSSASQLIRSDLSDRIGQAFVPTSFAFALADINRSSHHLFSSKWLFRRRPVPRRLALPPNHLPPSLEEELPRAVWPRRTGGKDSRNHKQVSRT